MKRFILSILSIIYLTAATGASLNLHYCMGELAGWNFARHVEKVCGKCGMEKNGEKENACCKDEFKHIRLEDDQKSSNTILVDFSTLQTVNEVEYPPVSLFFTGGPSAGLFSNNLTCRSSGVPGYITHCNFRI